jgi:two-component system nitrogen regulation sensor histidine kinase GlnL
VSGEAPLTPFEAYDQLATMVAVARSDGHCLLANSTLENTVAVSRRALQRGNVLDWFIDPLPMRDTLLALQRNEVTSGRFEALLRRAPVGSAEPLLVRVTVSQMDTEDRALLEIVEIEQQTRQDREERAYDLAQASKELLRNLAHEIKNPLGGIRGAAQLLEMELNARPAGLSRTRVGATPAVKPTRALAARGLSEYTQVIIREADRLQALVDRLLAPHRKPHVVSDVNIHEVCERVRLLVLSEFSSGLEVQRDYDTSIPEFRGDREQLIQALLNIVRNATQALAEQIAAGSARLVLRSRIARQVTIGKHRYRLALELHIQDNGPGVPDSIRDRIFHPLVSGRDGGSGLGLTLAQTFVQQHQGTIEFDSVPGRTDFKILIPLP